jgi:hypothetical protein
MNLIESNFSKQIVLIQLLPFWTLSIILFLFKTYNVSETGFYLYLQAEPTQLGPTDRASPSLEIGTRLGQTEQVPPEDGGRIQSPKPCMF